MTSLPKLLSVLYIKEVIVSTIVIKTTRNKNRIEI